ncbi:MAG: hypothetical protein J3Q66DRAFT_326588 [Benniella sp.]|nr:MAG: hypothetical protein J3Q66DRAFT_326588 [Benniella sp.]
MSTTEIPLNNLGPPTQDSGQVSREPLQSILSPTPRVPCRSSAGSAAANDEGEAHRRFFRDSSTPPTFTCSDTPAGVSVVIPEKTHTFKFTADFKECQAGHYVVQWRVNLLEDLSIPSGLRFSVNITYDSEEIDTTTLLDSVMPSESLQGLAGNQDPAVRGGKYDLRLEELVVIQPHEGQARVELALFNNDGIRRFENSGLEVDSVQFRPTATAYKRPDDVGEYVVERATKSTFNIEAMESLASALDTPLNTLPAISISRLAWAKDGWFLAALAVSKDEARIMIWDMSRVKDPSNPAADISGLHQDCVIATVEHQDIDKLSIGLAISAKGDQVAIYQEPKIGQWKAGSQVEQCEFQLHIYNFVLDVNQQTRNSVSGNTLGRLELQVGYPHNIFDTFIGYGAYLTKSDSGKWMKKGPEWMKELERMKTKPDPSRIDTVGVEDCGMDDGDEEESSDDENRTNSSEDSTVWTFFVACNGIYIDVFEISPELKWTHIHAIRLTDLVPTLNWRSTCLMLMETMTSNTFMWLEDDGCCSIWDLRSGSNITYISCKKNTTFYDTNIRETIRMAISPDESIVASADSDGTLTTCYTRTGIEIDNRRFLGHKVEYVGFHGKNNQLFVVFRDTVTFKLSSKILDPLLLKSDTTARTVPVPMIGTAIVAFSDKKGFDVEGLVCEVSGSRIRCYISHDSGASEVALDESTRVDTSTLKYQLPQSGDVGGQLYRIRTRAHKELFRGGDESMYWVSNVEIVEESFGQVPEKVIFSFVPESWTRVSTEGDTHPENLQSAYFLPGESRFVVTGIQTLQIWDLPKDNNGSCSLVFIWSQPIPRDDAIFISHEKGSGRVEDYYHKIQKSTIYLDQNSGNVVADVKLMHVTDTIQVHIPRSGCSNNPLVFRHFFRSVHLLAVTYAFCLRENKKTPKDSAQQTITFGNHANSIIRFTRDHINSVLFVKRQNQTGKEATTLLMLLVGRPDLKDSNHVFIEGLLNTSLDEWVPKLNKALNPIAFAISTKDEPLLKILIAYCIKCAKAYHPAYLFPVDQCLDELLNHFPDILADIFRKASYIPAQKQTFPLSRIQVVDFTYSDGYRYILKFIIFIPLGYVSPLLSTLILLVWIPFLFRPTLLQRLLLRLPHFMILRQRPPDANYSRKSVFTMRSQLPFFSYIRKGLLGLLVNKIFPFKIRYSGFPSMQINTTRINATSREVCVSPFQLQPVQDSKHESIVSKISGKDFFDIPAVVASLRLNWYTFGIRYWLGRFILVLVFFALVLITTAKRIHVSSPKDGVVPTVDEVAIRYSEVWIGVCIGVTCLTGVFLLAYEFMQCFARPSKYFRSPYNYIALAAIILPVIGFIFELKNASQAPPEGGSNQDTPTQGDKSVGPSLKELPFMSFAILLMYITMLLELRVIRPLGIAVNIIFNMMRKIGWYFLIFFFILVAFTHALLYALHTRQYKPCEGKSCETTDNPSSYPTDFGRALSATIFFLSGRYDPVDTSLKWGSAEFHVLMVIFYFFTAFLFINLLIALMNDAFQASEKEGELAHYKHLVEVIAEMEVTLKYLGNPFNTYNSSILVYYHASEKEVEQYWSKYSVSDVSSLSAENRFVVETSSANHHTIMNDIKTLAEEVRSEQKEMAELKLLVASILGKLDDMNARLSKE